MTCRPNGRNQPRLLTGHHKPDCDDDTCAGCGECPRTHCATCQRTHVDELNCIGCIAKTRETVREIVRLCRGLRARAADHSRDSTPSGRLSVLGGDAMVLLGPSSDGTGDQAARHRGIDLLGYDAALGYATMASLDLVSDPLPPKELIGEMVDDWRKVLGYPAAPWRMSLSRDADWLGEHMAQAAQCPDLDFAENASELARLQARLEAVLEDGDRVEHGAVPCDVCSVNLVGRFDDQGRRDEWECPRCGRTYRAAEYWLRVRALLEDVG